MSGGSEAHVEIESNLIAFLKPQLRDRGCRVFPAEMRIKVPSAQPHRYADFSALCGKAEFEEIGGVDALVNPTLIVEVLSTSTEAYDRGDKFTRYKSIPTFRGYLLVAQHRPHVTHLFKQDGDNRIHTEANDLEASVHLRSLDFELSMSEIYRDVTFDPPATT